VSEIHARDPTVATLEALPAIALLLVAMSGSSIAPAAFAEPPWQFAVSGDSRNCGDVVMPA